MLTEATSRQDGPVWADSKRPLLFGLQVIAVSLPFLVGHVGCYLLCSLHTFFDGARTLAMTSSVLIKVLCRLVRRVGMS